MKRGPVLHRLAQATRAAGAVRSGARAFANECIGADLASYRIRGSGDRVYVRHRTRDVEILNEIFSHRAYQPPEIVTQILGASPIRILDIGGNIGLFGLYARRAWTVASITSYEPDFANLLLLQATAQRHSTWRVEPSAVSNRQGTLLFVTGAFSESRAAREGETGVEVPMIDFFDLPLNADLIKMDIEGAEWPILTDRRLAERLDARAVVLEWHQPGCPESDPGAAAVSALKGAGFEIVGYRPAHAGAQGTLWAVNSKQVAHPIHGVR